MFLPINTETRLVDLGNLESATTLHHNFDIVSTIAMLANSRTITFDSPGAEEQVYQVFEPPKDDKQLRAILFDALQYFLVLKIAEVQRSSDKNFVYERVPQGTLVEPYRPEYPDDLEEVSYEQITLALSPNPLFGKNAGERWSWQHRIHGLRLPRGTHVLLRTETHPSGMESRLVILEKRSFFRIEMRIEDAGFEFRTTPVGFSYKDPAKIKTYGYRVRTEARFEQLASAHPKTAQYKQWAKWFLAQLRQVSVVVIGGAN